MTKTPDKDLLPEYDFSKGVGGKYAARVAKGSNVVVLDKDAQRVAMPDSVMELAERARALPPEERVRLVDLLLESLQEAAPNDVQEAWNKEIERRIAAHERGEVKVYDLDEVMDEARRIAP